MILISTGYEILNLNTEPLTLNDFFVYFSSDSVFWQLKACFALTVLVFGYQGQAVEGKNRTPSEKIEKNWEKPMFFERNEKIFLNVSKTVLLRFSPVFLFVRNGNS